MRPRSFNIGFGPALLKVTRNGIDYAIRAIPLGGFVKIPGMYRPSPDDVETQLGRSLREAPELTGPTKSLKRALEDGNEGGAQRALHEIEERAPARDLTGFTRGLQELGDSLSPQAYWRQPTWKRVAVIAAGPLTNLVFAVLLFTIVYLAAPTVYRLGFQLGADPADSTRVSSAVVRVIEGHPAARAGLRPGDAISAINGKPVEGRQISESIANSKGAPIVLTVQRDGRRVTLGPVRAQRIAGPGTAESVWSALKLTGIVTRETVKSLGRLVHQEGRDQISSPVGIVRVSSSAAHQSWEDYIGVLGFISLSLALLNLLPLLPLDGGHIAFALVEAIRGRALSRAIYERFSAVGIAIVLLLFFVGLSNDVGRLGGG